MGKDIAMKSRNIIASMAAGIAALAGMTWWLSRRGGRIEVDLPGDARTWKWREFDISYLTAGEGTPLVLLHGLYPGASNNQWAHNFKPLSGRFKVFAPDLLGFGLSSRPAASYNSAMYKDMIADFLKEVVKEPAVVLVSGQTSPFVIETATDLPNLITRLILEAPTGISRKSKSPSPGKRFKYRLWKLPIVGTIAYLRNTSKRRLGRRLKSDGVADPTLVTPSMVRALYKQSRQPGAKWAPIAAWAGKSNADIQEAYMRLTQPILIIWGEMPSSVPVSDAKSFLDLNSNAILKTIPDARSMPEYEHASKFNKYVEQWAEGKLAA